MAKAILLMMYGFTYGPYELQPNETEQQACYRAMSSLGIKEISAGSEMLMNNPGVAFSGGVTYQDGSNYPFGTKLTLFAGRTIPGHIVTCIPAPETK